MVVVELPVANPLPPVQLQGPQVHQKVPVVGVLMVVVEVLGVWVVPKALAHVGLIIQVV